LGWALFASPLSRQCADWTSGWWATFGIVSAMRVGLLLSPGFLSSALSSLLDVFDSAVALGEGSVSLETRVLGLTRVVRSSRRLACPTDGPLAEAAECDVVLVVGSAERSIDGVLDNMETRSGREVIRSVQGLRSGQVVGAACTGTFLLAEAGILERRRAATSWWLAPQFAKRYPSVSLDTDAMVVVDDHFVTAGAALAHLDLALHVVRAQSPIVAEQTARFLVIDERPSQAAYAAIGLLVVDDPLAREFERVVRANLASSLDVSTIAATIGTSRRTLDRRVRDAFGQSALSVIRHLRRERAQHLRMTTASSMEQVARAVGYENASTLRTLLR
jgi:transcriptional regulator GlxA family with amidase domain